MLDLTYLYGGRESGATPHRYGQPLKRPEALAPGQRHALAAEAAARRPVVVWHLTRRCNLACAHCYTDAGPERGANELSAAEGRKLLDELAAYNVPAVLFSGGEPTLRPDFLELAAHGVGKGLRIVVSTNGTVITPDFARRLKETGFAYVGISLDGLRETHDRFRGRRGAFDLALQGIRNCLAVGQKVGLRLTLTPANAGELPGVLALIEREGIPRACFYHLVPAGRGRELELLRSEEERRCMELLLSRAREWAAQGREIEVLTVDNPCDGPFLYLRLLREGSPRAPEALARLRWNGGALHGSGVGLADIDAEGNVHPDQFWMEVNFGNVRERPFREIWTDVSNPLLAGLKDRRGLVTGRCGRCVFFDACGGGLRSRAAHLTGDPWASDPACYLSDAEISGPRFAE
jgi:radical SAM protein with 4Fe4S-binding SPASM domain